MGNELKGSATVSGSCRSTLACQTICCPGTEGWDNLLSWIGRIRAVNSHFLPVLSQFTLRCHVSGMLGEPTESQLLICIPLSLVECPLGSYISPDREKGEDPKRDLPVRAALVAADASGFTRLASSATPSMLSTLPLPF